MEVGWLQDRMFNVQHYILIIPTFRPTFLPRSFTALTSHTRSENLKSLSLNPALSQGCMRVAHLVGFIGIPYGQVVAELQERLACLLVNVLHACHSHTLKLHFTCAG